MATEVIMPQMGESIAEGTITRWLVGVGEHVERDQPLLEISTDKVDAEIPSPARGTLLEVKFREGDTVEVDQVIAMIGEPSQASAASAPAASGPALAPPGPQSPRIAAPADAVRGPSAETSGPSAEREPGDRRQFASPVVKRIAAERGVDVSRITGTGLQGRVTKRDILQYLESDQAGEAGAETAASAPASQQTPTPQTGSTPSAPPTAPPRAASPARPPAQDRPPSVEPAARSGDLMRSTGGSATASKPADEVHFSVPAYRDGESVEIESMSRIRRLTAAHMLYSQQTSAHVTTVFDVDLTSMVAARNRVKDGFFKKSGTKLSFMPFLFRAVIDGLKTYPKFNASIDGTDIIYKKDINLGMAVALDWGLLVPVIHNADELNLVGLASRANDLAERARSKRLRPEEVQGGTFTVTNPGVFGSLFGMPLINQPQVAILCIGAIEKRPVVITDEDGNDGLGIRWMAYLALSYDHRLIDGADAEQFMVRVKQTLTDSSWDELSAYTD